MSTVIGGIRMNSKAYAALRLLLHAVLVFVGSGKTGKSCGAHALAEYVYPERVKVLYDPFRQFTTSPFPGYVLAHSLNDIPNGSVVFFEDAARLFPSRNSNQEKVLQQWIGTISHKDIIIIVTIQNTSDIDIELFRSQNTIFCHKMMYDEDIDYERDERVSYQLAANTIIRGYQYMFPGVDQRAWTYIARYNEVLGLPVPEWWGRQHSHMLALVRV
jgi:hypothetical protein